MKKLTLAFAIAAGFLTLLTPASAQITITSSDLPSYGLMVGTQKDTSGITVTAGNPSSSAQNWDFSSLTPQHAALIKFENASATPYATTFSAANIADTTAGVDGYNFFNATSSDFAVEGAEENVAFTYSMVTYNFQVEINLSPVFNQASLPATYGNIIAPSISYGNEIFNQTIIVFSKEKLATAIEYNDTVDAFGTMKMPNGKTYAVLRQKHNETDIDSVYGYLGGNWIFVERMITYKNQYDWYTNGIGYILAEMDMDTTSSTIKDVIWDTTTSAPLAVNEISVSGNSNVYPNPCSAQLNIVTTDKTAQSITIYDVTGREADKVEIKNGVCVLNTSAYTNGVYFYTLSDKSGTMVDRGKFTVQK